jgi:aconitase A
MPRFNNETRKKRIKELMRMLEKNLEVTKRDFENAVGKNFAKLYKKRWAEQQEIRKMEAPSEVKEYERMLQEALMMYGRYEQFTVDKNDKSGTYIERKKILDELSNKTDSLFEDAMERLEEIVSADQTLRIWFDRDIDFNFGSHLSIDPIGMPRVITSKSLDNLAKDEGMKRFGWQTMSEVKLGVLREAFDEFDKKEVTEEDVEAEIERNNQQALKLKSLLADLKKRR